MQTYFSSGRIGETLIPAFKAVMTSPSTYFEAMPIAHNYKSSMVLLAIYLLIPALIISVFRGVATIIFIVPISVLIGIIGTWLWAWYLGWAARAFCRVQLTTVDAFQICAFGAAPLVFSFVPVFGAVAFFWNLYLNWQGLVSHARLGGGAALLIILAAFVILGASLLLLISLLVYLASQAGMNIPEVQWF